MTSSVMARNEAVGGVVGDLQSGTITNNWAYTVIKGDAPYKGAIIGKIRGTNTFTNNYYGLDSSIADTTGAIQTEARLLTTTEANPIDTTSNPDAVSGESTTTDTPEPDPEPTPEPKPTPSDDPDPSKDTPEPEKTPDVPANTDIKSDDVASGDKGGGDSGGGGCETGFGIFGLVLLVGALGLKKSR